MVRKSEYKILLDVARVAAGNSYSPYSGFAVGSAVLGASGKIYAGANIENASYGLTNCAERSALFSALSAGEKSIKVIAVWTKRGGVFPCGACRQVIYEIAPKADVVINKGKGFARINMSKLLPNAFGKNKLRRKAK